MEVKMEVNPQWELNASRWTIHYHLSFRTSFLTSSFTSM